MIFFFLITMTVFWKYFEIKKFPCGPNRREKERIHILLLVYGKMQEFHKKFTKLELFNRF